MLKREIVRLAFEECGVSAYHNGVAENNYTETGTSPSKHDIVKLALRECGIPAYYGGMLPSDYVGGVNSPTAQQIIEIAFEECGQSTFNDGVTPEEYASAKRRLGAMMAEWLVSEEINLGYLANADLNAPSGIPATALHVVAVGLAMRIAPTIGKTMTDETRATWTMAFDNLKAFFTASALPRLDAMMAEWKAAYQITIGYRFSAPYDAISGIPDSTLQVVATGLALRIGQAIGREIKPDVKAIHATSFDALRVYYNSSPYSRLDSMMREWCNAYGINVGYLYPVEGTPSAADDDSGIMPGAEQVVVTSLAMRIAPTIGRSLSPEARAAHAASFANLRSAYTAIRPVQLHGQTPLGSGNRRYGYSRYFAPRAPCENRQLTSGGVPIVDDP